MKNKWLIERKVKHRNSFIESLYDMFVDYPRMGDIWGAHDIPMRWFAVPKDGGNVVVMVYLKTITLALVENDDVKDGRQFNLCNVTPQEVATLIRGWL